MIHISIPNAEEKYEQFDGSKKYHVYDLHLNGAYHASARYSALYTIHEKLLETFGHRLGNVEFPAKKFWRNMDAEAVNQRREGLTKYFHGVIQNVDTHSLLERLFLKLQVNSFSSNGNEVKLEIFLPDGHQIIVPCQQDDSSEIALKKFARSFNMEPRNISSFGLFLTRDRFREEGRTDKVGFDQMCVRWLKNFESPFISQQLINKAAAESRIEYRLCVRKTVWDPSVEEPLLDCPTTLKLIYLQTLSDIQRDVFRISQDAKTKLSGLQEQSLFKQFMHTCHMQASYGYELLSPAKATFNGEDCMMNLKVGRRQLLFEYRNNGVLSHLIIKSTKIRIWRVSHTQQNDNISQMVFELEYLVGKDKFNQLTLNTNQAVLLSLFLQSIAAEILRDMGRTSPGAYKFNDEIQSKVIENLEASKANSIVSDDYSVFDSSAGDSENGSTYSDTSFSLFKVISHQMPFDNENFSEITDSDL